MPCLSGSASSFLATKSPACLPLEPFLSQWASCSTTRPGSISRRPCRVWPQPVAGAQRMTQSLWFPRTQDSTTELLLMPCPPETKPRLFSCTVCWKREADSAGRSFVPRWTPDGEFGDQLLSDRALQEEKNGLQLTGHTAQPAVAPMTWWCQLWNKHRFQYQQELLSA